MRPPALGRRRLIQVKKPGAGLSDHLGMDADKEAAMYRRIALHLDQGYDCQRRTTVALALARRHKAEVLGIYASSAPPQYYYGESVLLSRALDVMKQVLAEDRAAVQNGFLASASAADVAASVRSAESSPSACMALYGRTADLIVLSQENPRDTGAAHEIEFVEQTLLSAGRPVLVVPSSGTFTGVGERIVYCWDRSREAARALADAMPLLKHAGEIVVLTMDEGESTTTREPAIPFAELATYFELHGVPEPRHVRRDIRGVGVGATILNTAADHSADLIVMGAYGHSKLREWAMGGATASVLESMTVPVLFSH